MEDRRPGARRQDAPANWRCRRRSRRLRSRRQRDDMSMKYINEPLMRGLDAAAFQRQQPYPWLNPEGFLTADGFGRLADSLPEPELFDKRFGEKRKHGQAPHDRLALEYRPDLSLSPPWREFIEELRGPAYRGFLERMFGRRAL